MRRHTSSCWPIILLLVARLIVGEFAHAMPGGGEMAHAVAADKAQPHEPACPDNADKTAGVKQSTPSADPPGRTVNADHGASHDTDCCKTAACECLCAHITAIATPSLTVSSALLDQSRVPASADGLMLNRLSALFRPPA